MGKRISFETDAENAVNEIKQYCADNDVTYNEYILRVGKRIISEFSEDKSIDEILKHFEKYYYLNDDLYCWSARAKLTKGPYRQNMKSNIKQYVTVKEYKKLSAGISKVMGMLNRA